MNICPGLLLRDGRESDQDHGPDCGGRPPVDGEADEQVRICGQGYPVRPTRRPAAQR